MEGLLFYWMAWMSWVVVMFFMPKTIKFRFVLLFHILSVISLAGYQLDVQRYSINTAAIYLFAVICASIRNKTLSNQINFICACVILALAYSSLEMFALLDPVWVIFSKTAMLAILINYAAILLIKDWKMRILSIILGLVLGDCLYAAVLYHIGMPYPAASFEWLDKAAVIIGAGLSWVLMETVIGLLQSYMKYGQREKQG
ncbi:hypothetical protein ACN6MY_16820 [Peribacillus sp. B-H-3]|uniref:YphA family membrane protein n=1 Tax=Peribacillus sp. B-H-3 TaxID=3400420 RepID=UPI003B01032E